MYTASIYEDIHAPKSFQHFNTNLKLGYRIFPYSRFWYCERILLCEHMF